MPLDTVVVNEENGRLKIIQNKISHNFVVNKKADLPKLQIVAGSPLLKVSNVPKTLPKIINRADSYIKHL